MSRGLDCLLVAAGLGLASMLGLAGPGGAQANPCTPPATDTGFAEVSVNVAAGTFDRVLPFDVPIRLCGQVPAGTRWVEVQAAAVAPKGGRRAPAQDHLLGSPTPVEVDPETCRIIAPSEASWQPDPPAEGRIDASTNTFRLVLPRLDAQRYYTFCLRLARQITAAQAAAFQPVARQTLDLALRQLRSGDLSSEDSARLRATLADALLASTGADEVIEPGTLFDPSLPQAQVRGEFNGLVREVLEPQLRRQAILEGRPGAAPGVPATASWASLQFDLKQSLDRIRTDPALGKLVAALGTAAETDPNLKTLLDQDFAAALALASSGDGEASRMALGQDPAGEDGATLADSWDPAAAAAAAASYDATTRSLGDLDTLIGRMTGDGAPAEVKAALTADDLAALAALAGEGGALERAGDLGFALSGLADDVQSSLADRATALDGLAREVALAAREVSVADGSTTGTFSTFQSYYVSADAGLVWAPEVDEVVSYVGTNIYLRPVNKNAPLRTLGSFGETFGRRFAFTLGLTVQSIADSAGGQATRDDLFGNQSLLTGAGLRLTDMIRFGAGALVFKRQDPDPLVNDLEVAVSYYLTVSFDLNVARAFQGGLGGLFGGS